jgi:hypothetical protein
LERESLAFSLNNWQKIMSKFKNDFDSAKIQTRTARQGKKKPKVILHSAAATPFSFKALF